MQAIIISGMAVSGKTTIADIVAKKLGMTRLDGGDVLKEIAVKNGYKALGSGWWESEEGFRFLKARQEDFRFDKEADKIMVQRVKEGDVVVTSWTAPWLTMAGFRVWLDGTVEERADRLAGRDNINMTEALRLIGIRDLENKSLYKRMYNIKLDSDKSPFNLVIEIDSLKPERIAELILEKYK